MLFLEPPGPAPFGLVGLFKQAAVGQAGERVFVGKVSELLPGALELGDELSLLVLLFHLPAYIPARAIDKVRARHRKDVPGKVYDRAVLPVEAELQAHHLLAPGQSGKGILGLAAFLLMHMIQPGQGQHFLGRPAQGTCHRGIDLNRDCVQGANAKELVGKIEKAVPLGFGFLVCLKIQDHGAGVFFFPGLQVPQPYVHRDLVAVLVQGEQFPALAHEPGLGVQKINLAVEFVHFAEAVGKKLIHIHGQKLVGRIAEQFPGALVHPFNIAALLDNDYAQRNNVHQFIKIYTAAYIHYQRSTFFDSGPVFPISRYVIIG